jgi:hypothetical protein
VYLLEGGAIAPIIAARCAKCDRAAAEHLCHNGSYLADSVILLVITDVEDFVVHGITRCFKSEYNCLANVIDVDERAPRRSVAGHLDLFGSPGESGEIVENDIEAHPRAGAESRCVA